MVVLNLVALGSQVPLQCFDWGALQYSASGEKCSVLTFLQPVCFEFSAVGVSFSDGAV